MMRVVILLLIAAIISGLCGFAVDQAAILYGQVEPIGAQCLGIATWAAVLLVLIAAMRLQAKEWR